MRPTTTGLLSVHGAALLFGGTALFSKLVSLPATHITCYRAMIAVPALLLLARLQRAPLRLSDRRQLLGQIGIGLLLGLHWWTYFQAMQSASVAIGLISLFTAPLITLLLSPLFGDGRITPADLALALLVCVGVALLVDHFSWQAANAQGVVWGLASALLLSLRNLSHRRMQRATPGSVLMLYQIATTALLFLPVLLLDARSVAGPDWGLLLLLGCVFTALPHGLIAAALARLPASTVTLLTSAMLVYGSLLAWLLLGEQPALRTVLGGLVVGACALIATRRAQRGAAAPDPVSER